MKDLKGYRTLIINGTAFVVGAIALVARSVGVEGTEVDGETVVNAVGSAANAVIASLAVIMPIVNAWLRSITTSPIFKK